MKHILFLIVFLPIIMWSQSNFKQGEKLFKEEKYQAAQDVFESFLKICIISEFCYGTPTTFVMKNDGCLRFFGFHGQCRIQASDLRQLQNISRIIFCLHQRINSLTSSR